MFISLIGLCNLMFGWPIIFILDITDIEKLEWYRDNISLDEKIQIFTYMITASITGFCKHFI
jgi:hypothetical protein